MRLLVSQQPSQEGVCSHFLMFLHRRGEINFVETCISLN
jgi:hypothetical protein